ncbi:MAG TPA: hypothetical protein VFZ40_14425 [Pyrinomonadaceae bacterium]
MKSIGPIGLVLLSMVFTRPVAPPVPPGSSTLGIFVATSPCDSVSRTALKIPATANCEMIKWRLTLFEDAKTLAPTNFELKCAYGLAEQGTTGLSKGETKVGWRGTWKIVSGADATVYELDLGMANGTVSFRKVDHNLLHLLDQNKSLALGNAGWSYTLNRTGDLGINIKQAAGTTQLQLGSPAAYASQITTDSSMLGRFVGRSPCHEVASQLSKAVPPDCMKVKWDLTLYHDRNTLAPNTYKLRGTFFRERVREGKWTIVRGTKTSPNAVVYQLDPDKPLGSLFLLKADSNILFFLDKEGNHLIGNANFSYTLNREAAR